jgi:uncharacterized BrkB/YihY/UPF0761 family membrane protein
LADVPAADSRESGAEAPAGLDWAAALPSEAAGKLDNALSRLWRRAWHGVFVGSVLAVLLVLIVAVSLAFGWVLVWVPSETYQLASSGHFRASAFGHDFVAALGEIGNQVNRLLG